MDLDNERRKQLEISVIVDNYRYLTSLSDMTPLSALACTQYYDSVAAGFPWERWHNFPLEKTGVITNTFFTKNEGQGAILISVSVGGQPVIPVSKGFEDLVAVLVSMA